MLSKAETAELLEKHPDFKKGVFPGIWKHKTGASITDSGYLYWLIYFALKGHIRGPFLYNVVPTIDQGK